jgi:glycosyltransferase involved in cell wall biosynthesis
LRKKLQKRTRELKISNSFKFLGEVPNILEMYHKSDIFIRPSLTEGMPLAVLESMACGIPVIATDVGGTSEIVRNNKTGILVQPGEIEELANSILKLLDDLDLAEKLSKNAREFVEQHCSWDDITKNTSEVYEKLL